MSCMPHPYEVSAIIIAYNLFINVVDRFNQLFAGNITKGKERRVPMLVFTFLLGASVIIANALYRIILEAKQTIIHSGKPHHAVPEYLTVVVEFAIIIGTSTRTRGF